MRQSYIGVIERWHSTDISTMCMSQTILIALPAVCAIACIYSWVCIYARVYENNSTPIYTPTNGSLWTPAAVTESAFVYSAVCGVCVVCLYASLHVCVSLMENAHTHAAREACFHFHIAKARALTTEHNRAHTPPHYWATLTHTRTHHAQSIIINPHAAAENSACARTRCERETCVCACCVYVGFSCGVRESCVLAGSGTWNTCSRTQSPTTHTRSYTHAHRESTHPQSVSHIGKCGK